MAAPPESEWPYEVSEFACHRCGNCCRGDGDVVLTADDVTRLAAHAGLEEAAYLARYTVRREDGATCLIDQGDALRSCVYLTPENTCEVHALKPTQCVGFPMKWRPGDALEICAGLRAAAGLPYPTRRTMNRRTG
ncbi:YkgJ family cysteine cluster protein [Nannocystis bainbridge]|uniref:YkgJ family cysteine cluster protein n=1 Tax=Nannocystis bainbridge TaxID=2995303 RepID=A0ABT5DYG8_9BACT|nr:YkgJ family cysteine cluster protein [Nannocystis bainbridge]MDC0718190.1 YkgJ family cysteine cluster protein [Nannocystis bainbridge]